MRAFYFLTLADSAGTGLFLSGSVLFLIHGVGLSTGQVGIGLGAAGLVGFLATVPLGLLANRSGARRMLLLLQIWRGVCYLLYAFIGGFWQFVLLACLAGAAERMDPPLTQAVLGTIVGDQGRGHAYVQVRRIRNAGYGIGTLFAGLAALHNSVLGYRLLLVGNSLSFFVAALLLARIGRVPRTTAVPGNRLPMRQARAIRDLTYLRLTGLNVLLSLHLTLTTVAIPLWILEHTHAPRAIIQVIFGLSILTVILFQGRFSRAADTEQGSRRCLAWASCGISLGAGLLALAAWAHNVVWAVILLIAAALLVTAAELWQTVAGWNLSYALAPPAQRSEYLSVFSLSNSAQRIIGPPLFTLVVMPLGPPGWIIFGVIFAVIAALIGTALGAPATAVP